MPASSAPVFLFDIDGTLLKLKSGFMQEFIAGFFRNLGMKQSGSADTSFAGRTDRDIFSSLMDHYGIAPDEFDRVKDVYVKELDSQLQPEHIDRLDGVVESINFCLENNIPIGLLTGNFEEAAYIKLRNSDLDSYFSFGAFGCDHKDRKNLPAVALERARDKLGHVNASDLVIIGDTPNDINCANHSGSVSVAVATGPFDIPRLMRYEPDFAIPDLTKPDQWITEVLKRF